MEATESKNLKNAVRKKKLANAVLILALLAIEALLIWQITVVAEAPQGGKVNSYHTAGILMIIVWFGIMVAYLTWAIYFFNLNLGITNEDWARIKEFKQFDQIPKENPNTGQTLGLPQGTIRGLMAVTLMVSALAMVIASLGMDDNIGVNQVHIDHFVFFKDAFLMMIAFYFGNKALGILRTNSNKRTEGMSKESSGGQEALGTAAETETSEGEHADAGTKSNDFDQPGAVG